MSFLWTYLKKYKIESVLAPLFKMLEAILELFVPLVVTRMIDVGIAGGSKPYLLRMGGMLLLQAAVGLLSSVTAQYFAAKAAIGCAADLRGALFRHINTLSYTELDTLGTSTLITRLTNDVNQVQVGVNMVLRLFLRSPFIVFGAMLMAFTVSVRAALVFVVAIPLLFAAVFGVMFFSLPLFKKIQTRLDRVTLLTRENLSGIRVIRAFNREPQEVAAFNETTGELAGLQMRVGRVSALLNPVTYVVLNLAIVAILWQGGRAVQTGALTQGAVVALVNYMSQILVELIKLSNLIVTINKSAACEKRLAAVMEEQTSMTFPAADAAPIENAPAVAFAHVDFRYKNAKAPALEDITFQIEQGQTVGVIGATGAGKSTLTSLIPRFYDCTAGTVRLFGRDVREYTQETLRRMVAVVPQKNVLFHGTLQENLRWGNETASAEVLLLAMRTAQGEDVIAAKGDADFMIEQDGRNLSGGQKQRIAIARALVKRAPVLILDDSMSALDFATDARLRKAIRESTKNTTVFLVSQRVTTVKNADVILVLEDGAIVGTGTHESLIETCAEYREICLSQLSAEEVTRHG